MAKRPAVMKNKEARMGDLNDHRDPRPGLISEVERRIRRIPILYTTLHVWKCDDATAPVFN